VSEHRQDDERETFSTEQFATPGGVAGPLATSATGGNEVADPTDESGVATARVQPEGQSSASSGGGYGSPSGRGSGGSGEATPETSDAGNEAQTDWLRDAPGGASGE
jgi:hypothetical protein